MEEIVERAKAGDEAAIERLLQSVAPAIQRFGLRMCKTGHDADDVLQDTLMAILRHLPEFEGRSSFTSWVFALTRTSCSRRRRGLKNQPGVELDSALELDDGGPTPEASVEQRQLGRQLTLALDALPDEYREVILLRDVEAMTAPEVAEALNLSVDAVKSRLHRARHALRNQLRRVLETNAPAPSASCPDIMALWSRKLEGELDALDCATMEKHLAGCPSCDAACAALKTALVACRRESQRDVSPEVQAQVKVALRSWLKLASQRPEGG